MYLYNIDILEIIRLFIYLFLIYLSYTNYVYYTYVKNVYKSKFIWLFLQRLEVLTGLHLQFPFRKRTRNRGTDFMASLRQSSWRKYGKIPWKSHENLLVTFPLWIGFHGKIETWKPHISWGKRWFPVKMFPWTNPLIMGKRWYDWDKMMINRWSTDWPFFRGSFGDNSTARL